MKEWIVLTYFLVPERRRGGEGCAVLLFGEEGEEEAGTNLHFGGGEGRVNLLFGWEDGDDEEKAVTDLLFGGEGEG